MLGGTVTFGPKSVEKRPQQENFFELTTPRLLSWYSSPWIIVFLYLEHQTPATTELGRYKKRYVLFGFRAPPSRPILDKKNIKFRTFW